VLKIMYAPFDVIFSFMFFYCTTFLRVLTISVVFVISLGKFLSITNTHLSQFFKYVLYIWYAGYSLYSLGIIDNLKEMSVLDWSTFTFSIVAPICMVILARQLSSAKVKGRQIFVYPVIVVVYVIISFFWWWYVPDSGNFTFLFVVIFIVAFFIFVYDYLKG